MPSQPPQNVRAISVTSDEAAITWAEPPRMTLHGVLKGYRVVFWAVFPDGGNVGISKVKGPGCKQTQVAGIMKPHELDF